MLVDMSEKDREVEAEKKQENGTDFSRKLTLRWQKNTKTSEKWKEQAVQVQTERENGSAVFWTASLGFRCARPESSFCIHEAEAKH